MNCFASKVRPNQWVLSVLLVFSTAAAYPQSGMLEIRGVLTSPVCAVEKQNITQLVQQTRIRGQACGLTTNGTKPMAQMIIARISEETLSLPAGSNSTKQLVTLTYH
jgi:hypothetical protein